jgi:hypothetical protein
LSNYSILISGLSVQTQEYSTVEAEADQIALELRRGEVDVETVTDRIKKDEARLASGNATPKEFDSNMRLAAKKTAGGAGDRA